METEKEPKLYEIAYFVKAGEDEQEAISETQKIRDAIEQKKGIVAEDSKPAKKKLAYEIQKQNEGYFGWLKFLLKPLELEGLKKEIKKIPSIIRFSIYQAKKEEIMERRAKRRKRIIPEEEKAQIKEIDKKLEELLG